MSANSEEPQLGPVDVVILTAITLEYSAVLKVNAGAYPGSKWIEKPGTNRLPLAFRTFQGRGGHPLHVAVGQAGDMGSLAAATALIPLVDKYRPKCIAMSGVCAGRPGKTNLGDVIAAERLFFHDTGKLLSDEVQQDLKTYNLRVDWKIALERFDFAERLKAASWWQHRPTPYQWQENWVLAKLHEGINNPSELPECDEYCPQWDKVIVSLWKSGDIHDYRALALTDQGQARVQRMLIRYRNRFPDLSPSSPLLPFRVHVAPMGSGNKVIEDERVWSFVSEHMRKTLGLEMEAVALGAIAHAQRDHRLDALVMKGVMDFANNGRDDHFKEFAARAAAECLIAFLREHVEIDTEMDVRPAIQVDAAFGVSNLVLDGRRSEPQEHGTQAEQEQAIALLGSEIYAHRRLGRDYIHSILDKKNDLSREVAKILADQAVSGTWEVGEHCDAIRLARRAGLARSIRAHLAPQWLHTTTHVTLSAAIADLFYDDLQGFELACDLLEKIPTDQATGLIRHIANALMCLRWHIAKNSAQLTVAQAKRGLDVALRFAGNAEIHEIINDIHKDITNTSLPAVSSLAPSK